MSPPRHVRQLLSLLLALALAGCASLPTGTAYQPNPALRTIEVAVGDFAPAAAQINPPAVVSKTLKAGLAGASGGIAGMALMAPTCSNPFTMGVCVIFMPVYAIMAVAGGTVTAMDEKSAHEMHAAAQQVMSGIFDAAAMQRDLAGQVLGYAHAASLRSFRATDDASKDTSADARLEVAITAVDGIDVQAGAFEVLSTHYVLVLEARARLKSGTAVLQDKSYRYVSAPGTMEAWAEDAGKRLRDEVKQGQAQFAEWIIDDFFRGRVSPQRLKAPKPVLPAPTFALFGPVTKSGLRRASNAGALLPTLGWRPVLDDAATDPSTRHEVLVYRAEKIGRHLWAMSPVYRRSGLAGTTHPLETPLEPCAYYVWTVRSTRVRDGEREVSEWWGNWWESMPAEFRRAQPKIDHASVLKINQSIVLDQRLPNYGFPLATPCAAPYAESPKPGQAPAAEATPADPQAAPAGTKVPQAELLSKLSRTDGFAGAAKGIELGMRLRNGSGQTLPGFRVKVELYEDDGDPLGSFSFGTAPLPEHGTVEVRHTVYPLLFGGITRLRELPLEQVRARFFFDAVTTPSGPLPH